MHFGVECMRISIVSSVIAVALVGVNCWYFEITSWRSEKILELMLVYCKLMKLILD